MDIKKRLLPAALIVVVTFGCILLSRFTRVAFFLALAVASAVELHQTLFKAEQPMSLSLPIVYCAVQAGLCWFGAPVAWMVAAYAAAAFAVFFWGVLKPERGMGFVMVNLFVLLWPFGFYAIVLHAAASDIWLMTLMLGVLGTWACDSMALIGGRWFGKNKLAPKVSPHKTWEGAVVGAASAPLAGALIALVMGWDLGMCVVTAFVASTVGQVGDLAASLVKRYAGVKDYGHLMPEHGGIMDKMDSMLFAIPTAYFLVYLFLSGAAHS